MTLRISDQAFRTDTGRQRNANEDSLFTRGNVFVVADGMGGAQAGEVASKAAAESFDRELPQAPPERVLEETIEAANRTIHEQRAARPRAGRDGDDDDGGDRRPRGRGGGDRPRRRQPRLPLPRRPPRTAHPRPLAGRGDAAQGPAHRRPGRGPPAALDHHPRARPRTGGRGRRADGAGAGRRRLPDLLRRADDDARRRARRPHPRPRHLDATAPSAPWSTKPTAPAAATTSPSSPSASCDAAAPVAAAAGGGPPRTPRARP